MALELGVPVVDVEDEAVTELVAVLVTEAVSEGVTVVEDVTDGVTVTDAVLVSVLVALAV